MHSPKTVPVDVIKNVNPFNEFSQPQHPDKHTLVGELNYKLKAKSCPRNSTWVQPVCKLIETGFIRFSRDKQKR